MESKLFGGMRHEHICARRLDGRHAEGKAGDVEESDGETVGWARAWAAGAAGRHL